MKMSPSYREARLLSMTGDSHRGSSPRCGLVHAVSVWLPMCVGSGLLVATDYIINAMSIATAGSIQVCPQMDGNHTEAATVQPSNPVEKIAAALARRAGNPHQTFSGLDLNVEWPEIDPEIVAFDKVQTRPPNVVSKSNLNSVLQTVRRSKLQHHSHGGFW
jgi:hypothetical protein